MNQEQIRLAVFDFDHTLVKTETIDALAEAYGVGEQVSEITQLAMTNKIDFFSALEQRVKLLQGMDSHFAKQVIHQFEPMPGAIETIAELKKAGVMVIVFSGGFTLATNHFRPILGYQLDFSNTLHLHHQTFTGKVGGPMMFGNSKGVMLMQLQKLLNIDEANTLVCGDGANDLSMFQHAGMRVAFGNKGVLDEYANVIVHEPNLAKILDHMV